MLSIVQSTCPGEDLEENFFSKKPRHFSFGNWAVNFVVFHPNLSRNDCQKCLVPFRSNTFNQAIISGKLCFSLSCLDLEGGNTDRVVKKRSTLTEQKWRKVVFTSNDLILDIVFSLWTKLLGFRSKNFNRDVNSVISASRWTTSGETSFFPVNYQFQFILGISGLRVWTFSQKKIRTFRTAVNVSGDKLG